MKYASSFALLSSVVFASPMPQSQDLGSAVTDVMNKGYGRVADVPGATARRQVLESRAKHIDGATTVKVRYGPYKIPSSEVINILGEAGTLYNYPDLGVEKPCGDCVLVGMNAGLEYPDGRDANTKEGLWLHHMVLLSQGPGRMDPTCVGKESLPHMVVGTTPDKAERFFSSGNERSRVNFAPPWAPEARMGYFLNKEDKFLFIVDLMNMNKQDEVVYMTITYDYVEGRPAGFDNMKAIWLDAAQCGTSEVIPPVQKGIYEVGAEWIANLDGEILGAGGHVHDGGKWLSISIDDKVVCNATATYGSGGKGMGGPPGGGMNPSAAAVAKVNVMLDPPSAGGHGHGGGKGEHITAMSACLGEKMGKWLKKGQKWNLKAHYDYDQHAGMVNSEGQQENVMAISIMYIKNPKI